MISANSRVSSWTSPVVTPLTAKTLYHLAEADESVRDQHAAGDDDDLDERDRGDGRIDLPFEILQDRARQGGLARPDEEQRDLEIAERDDEAEERRRHHRRADHRQGDADQRAP